MCEKLNFARYEVKAQSDSDLEHGGDDVHVRLQILRFTASQILLQAGLGAVLRMMCRQQYRARSGSWDSHCCVSSDSRLLSTLSRVSP